MKRFVVSAFAILYIVITLGIAINRTAVWLDGASNRQSSDLNASINKLKDFVPHYRNARIVQNQFVVETPLIASEISLVIDRHLDLTVDEWVYGQSPLQIPPRAPPSLI